MKTTPMQHQTVGLQKMKGRQYYGLLCEQGTGKTWMLLADAERLAEAGEIDALVVVAPKGVHTNWSRREIPAHLSIEHRAVAYMSGLKTPLKRIKELYTYSGFKIITINIDAVNTKTGFQVIKEFMTRFNCMLVVDESSRIKNPTALRTKKLLQLRDFATHRRIATGTPITNAPTDIYSQFKFLHRSLLGTNSYRAFVAEYAVVLPPTHDLVASIIDRRPGMRNADGTVNTHRMPQIIATDSDGNKQWRNLDRLQTLIEPHAYRVTKDECLDLPDKIYQNRYFELTPQQRRIYKRIDEHFLVEINETTNRVNHLTAMGKLQQVTSGFVITPEDGAVHFEPDNPRMSLLMDCLEDIDPGNFIVWARYREEIKAIAAAMESAGIPTVEYHGGVKPRERELAVDSFQSGEARCFIGNPQAGGIGLTLTAAKTVIYYSNDFSLENRLQSEDRCHRKGTRHPVVYIDLVAIDTIDERIAAALQRKQEVAEAVLDVYKK